MRTALIVLALIALFAQTTRIDGNSCNQQAFSFGYNEYGQLGDTTNINQNIPVPIDTSRVLKGLNITAITGGDRHSLAVADGKAFSFGLNENGQLGDGTYSEKNIPVAVSTSGFLNGMTVTAACAGSTHSLVLSSTGQVFSFGSNNHGQLGDGTYANVNRNTPVSVDTSGDLDGKTIITISCGDESGLVLSSDGQVFGFGRNAEGQLGDGGNNNNRYVPVAIDTSGVLSGVTITAIAAGWYHSIVLSSTGQAFSFGYNYYGQLGVGTTLNKNVPVAILTNGVLNGQTIAAISAGGYHSLVLSASGKVFSFGRNNYGQLGDGTTTDHLSPISVDTSGVLNGKTVTAIAAGAYHSLAYSANGQLFSWGSNQYGQLGDGTTTTQRNLPGSVLLPNEVVGLGISRLETGSWHSMFLVAPLKNVIGGTVRDGATPGKQILFQSNTDKVSANWDAFKAIPAVGQPWIVKKYNITTIEVETGQVVLGPRLIEFESESQVFSTEETSSVSLQHNMTYFTQINTPSCNSESMNSIGFRVDTTAPEIDQVNLLTSRWAKNADMTMEWAGLNDPESGIASAVLFFFDVDDEVTLYDNCNVTIGGSAGQVNLTWESCGVKLPTGKTLKIGISAENGAGLSTTKLSVNPFRVVDLKITKLINGETDSGSALKACRLATIEWESLGLNGTTVMLSLVKPDSPYEVVLNITQQPVPAQQNQFRWEPVSSDVPLGSFRISLKSMSPLDLDLVSLSGNTSIIAADVCIDVTSPDKASIWKAGESHSIEWTVSGSSVSGDVKVELLKDRETISILGSTAISRGSFSWVVPSNLFSDTNYQIRTSSVSSQGLVFSTSFFEIVATAPGSSPSSRGSSSQHSNEFSSHQNSQHSSRDSPGLQSIVWVIVFGIGMGLIVFLLLICIVVVIVVAIALFLTSRRKLKPEIEQQLLDPPLSLESKSALDSMAPAKVTMSDSSTSRSSSMSDSNASKGSSTTGSTTSISPTTSFCLIPPQELAIEREIGRGCFGIVSKAKYKGRIVAFKSFTHMVQGRAEDFHKEVETMAKLQHPRLVELIGIVNDDQAIGIVMEFVERGSLDNFLWRKKDSATKLSWGEKLAILHDIATGMAFVHSKGFTHRDLKSLNVLIGKDNRAKVADLGLARSIERTTSTLTAQVGSGFWMAPEVSSGSGNYDEKCDVFSFGIIMNEILSEKEPYFNVKNKQTIIFSIAKFTDYRPLIPTMDYVKQNLLTEIEWAFLEKHFKAYISLMQFCWQHDPRYRPSFTQVITRLNELAAV